MPIDPSIALGVKPMQIESPINQMAKVYELQNMQQASQANQLAMQEKQRAFDEQNALRNRLAAGNLTDPTELLQFGATGRQAYESLLKGQKDTREARSAELDALSKTHGIFKNTMGSIIATPTLANAINTVRKTGRMLGEDVEDDVAELTALGENPDAIRQWATGHSIEADKLLEQHFVNQENVMVNGVPTSRVLQVPKYGTGAARTVEGSQGATYNKPAASTVVNVNNAQEKEFEKQVGKDQAEILKTSKAGAEDAAQILATNMVGKTLLDKGMLTGVGANFFTTLNQGLSQAGIDFGYADAAQNSQAYGALMAANTAKIIKQFGAGTGLSDADREYALKAAAGDIKMDENAIRKILTINNRAAQNAITKHNKMVKTVEDKTKTILPYSVEVSDYTAGIPEGRTEKDTRKPLSSLIKSKRN